MRSTNPFKVTQSVSHSKHGSGRVVGFNTAWTHVEFTTSGETIPCKWRDLVTTTAAASKENSRAPKKTAEATTKPSKDRSFTEISTEELHPPSSKFHSWTYRHNAKKFPSSNFGFPDSVTVYVARPGGKNRYFIRLADGTEFDSLKKAQNRLNSSKGQSEAEPSESLDGGVSGDSVDGGDGDIAVSEPAAAAAAAASKTPTQSANFRMVNFKDPVKSNDPYIVVWEKCRSTGWKWKNTKSKNGIEQEVRNPLKSAKTATMMIVSAKDHNITFH